MKKMAMFLTALLLITILNSCGVRSGSRQSDTITVVDSEGSEISLRKNAATAVAVGASLADLWLLAGGELAGVTSDAGEQGVNAGNAADIGTMRQPGVEKIIELSPDIVLLSPDVGAHREAAELFKQAGLACFMAKNDSLDDYLFLLKTFTDIMGETERYQEYGVVVKEDVDAVLEEISGNSGKTALFLRASSTDVKAKADDNAACAILHDLGVDNIAAGDDSLLESLSMEAIIERDPDYIFAVMMGGDADAEATLQSMLMANPAWKDLSAVQNGNFEILPKELFHYKPNADWGRAYEYLYECIYQ